MILQEEYNLNLESQLSKKYVKVSQYDTGRRLLITLIKNDGSMFKIPSEASASINGLKPDGNGFSYDCSIENNKVVVDMKEQMTVLAGYVKCEILLSKGGERIATANFMLSVEESPLSENTPISETDLPLLQKAIEASETVLSVEKTVKGYSESASQSAQSAQTSAESATSASASSAESATNSLQSAQASAESANSASQSATNASASAESASTSANTASTKATEASTSATKAKESETNAKQSETNASNSAKQAQTSADSIANVTSDVDKLKEDVSAITPRLEVVEKQVANTNLDNLDLRNIILDVESGLAKAKYPIGTQLIFDWNRVDGNGNKTLYNPAMNITHYENATVKDSDTDAEREANVMYLEWDKTIPDGFPFCIQQALQCFDGTEGTPNGLPRGTYCIKMVAKNGGQTFRNRWDRKYATFTLTKDIPQGGTLRLTINTWDGDDTSKLGLIFRTYASANQNDAVIETFTANEPSDTQPSDAIFMGEVWGEDVGYGKINHPESCYYGDNTWAHCDLRQWLNGEGTDWWTKQTRYHIKPNIVNSLQGYLTGLDENLKKNIVKVKNTTIGNNMKYKDVRFETYDTIFLASFNQRNITTDFRQQFDNEGKVWDYYKQLASGVDNLNNGMFKIWQTYPVLIRYAINQPTAPQFDFGRSAYLYGASNVHIVGTSGRCSSTSAGNGNRCRPACVIAKKNRTTEVGA